MVYNQAKIRFNRLRSKTKRKDKANLQELF